MTDPHAQPPGKDEEKIYLENAERQHEYLKKQECMHMDDEVAPGLLICKNCGRAVRLDD